jgi:hypothetical protein
MRERYGRLEARKAQPVNETGLRWQCYHREGNEHGWAENRRELTCCHLFGDLCTFPQEVERGCKWCQVPLTIPAVRFKLYSKNQACLRLRTSMVCLSTDGLNFINGTRGSQTHRWNAINTQREASVSNFKYSIADYAVYWIWYGIWVVSDRKCCWWFRRKEGSR